MSSWGVINPSDQPRLRFVCVFLLWRNQDSRVVFKFLVKVRTPVRVEMVAAMRFNGLPFVAHFLNSLIMLRVRLFTPFEVLVLTV